MELRITTLIGMIAFAAMTRLLPHPPNFTAVTALALFAGVQIPDRRLALVAPLAALFATDLVLGVHSGMLLVYLCVALVVGLGAMVGPRLRPQLAGASVAASVLFFVVTNLGVWMMDGLYPLTLAGLGACFVAAIPFFQNGLAGDLLFTAALFGGYELLARLSPALSPAR